jgi:hypothetical protein
MEILGAQYDSINTIDEFVDQETEKDQIQKDWQKIAESRKE